MLTIQKARRCDAEAAWEIRKAAILTECIGCYPLAKMQAWAGEALTETYRQAVAEYFYVTTLDAQIVGTGMVNLESGKIAAVFVHPHHLRKGIGKVMMQYLEQLAVKQGVPQLSLISTLNATQFYRACGFSGGEVVDYVSTTGIILDSVPMRKRLASG